MEEKIEVFIGAMILLVFAIFISGAVVMLLWNWLIPVVFSGLVSAGYIAGHLTFWQAWGLAALGRFIFGYSTPSTSSKK